MRVLPAAFSALNQYKQFIIYVVVPSQSRPGKTDKKPIDPITGLVSSPVDPAIWTDAETAIKVANQYGPSYGVGFVLTESDPFWFLDIDNHYDPINKTWSALAQHFIGAFSEAAIEVSHSGRGLHIIGSGNAPPHCCKNPNNLDLELYTAKRFIALTGIHARGCAATDYSALLPWLVDNYFPPLRVMNDVEWTDSPCTDWNGPADDVELIDRALRSQSARAAFGGTASFRDLWEANIQALAVAYPDQYRDRSYDESSADAALAAHLAYWTGNNCDRMLRLMWQSKLAREKWSREDYLQTTVLKACALQTKWLNDKPPQSVGNVISSSNYTKIKPELVTGNTFLTIEQQVDLFAGCVYIRDIHQVLIPGGHLLKPDQFRADFGGFSFPMDIKNEKVTRDAWEAFSRSQAFRKLRADSSCFRPNLAPGEIIQENGMTLANVWWPVETPRLKGDVTPFLTHLAKLLPNPRDQQILLSYMAACVQYKGEKFQWTPLIQGVEGNGKTLFSRCVEYAVGYRYSHFPKAKEIAAKFNQWMYRKIFIGVEDIYVPDSQREVLEALKPMITRERQEIEPKGMDKITLDVCCNFILNSNHKDAVRKTRDNRIFAPFYTAQQSLEDILNDGMGDHYFINLYNWLRKQGGYAMVSEFLHTYKIPDEFNPARGCMRAPPTSSTEDAILQSAGGVEQEILESIAQGERGFKNGWISSMALDRLLVRLNMGRLIPHNKRRGLLQSLGYDLHPGLKDGRVADVIMIDGGKPRLYIIKGHATTHLTGSAKIAEIYTADQQ